MKTHCSSKLPSKYVFGLREFSKNRLRCRGWFLSPYKDLTVKVSIPGKETLSLKNFESQPEVREVHPEYEQDGRGFFFEAEVPESCEYFDFSLCAGTEVVEGERFLFDSFYDANWGNGKKTKEELIEEAGKFHVPNGNARVPYVALEKASFERNFLLMTGSFFSFVPPSDLVFLRKGKELKREFLRLEEEGEFFFRGERIKKYFFRVGLLQWSKPGEKVSLKIFSQEKELLMDYGVSTPFLKEKKSLKKSYVFKEKEFLITMKKELIL